MELPNDKVDEELYSRQLYVIGHDAMIRMMGMEVLIIGLDGLGQEIAKNICLAGLRSVSLYDKSPVTMHSLCAGFYFSKADIGEHRDASALKKLKDVNKYVNVKVVDEINIEKYHIIVAVNQTLKDNLRLSGICHTKKIKFVMANVSGLFGQIFCDFQSYICVDNNGESPSTGSINDITMDGVATVINGSTHSLEDGDSVRIQGTVYKVRFISRTQFRLENYKSKDVKVGEEFEQVKIPFTIEFKDLKAALEEPEIMNFDYSDAIKSVHDLFTHGKTNEKFKELEEVFTKTKGCLIAPMCSVIGGLAAQEVIKASSSKFTPFKQFYYYEAADAYIGGEGEEQSFINSRYFDMIKIFGNAGFDKICKMKIFLVGSGAIGCENIKNFVMTGLCSNGRLSITDMDSIEPSNLNRQFLFRSNDILKMKSDSAARNALELNEDFAENPHGEHPTKQPIDIEPSLQRKDNEHELVQEIENIQLSGNLVPYTLAVGPETEQTFSDMFLKDQDLVANALDNVEARNYMDRRCIQMRKPLIDAGTLGTKGHVQVVVPFLSENYASSEDPQEKSIPLCTIKSFPYAIEHTIEWALSEFKDHFNEKVNKIEENGEECDEGSNEEHVYAPRTVEECCKCALALFVQSFSTSIAKLLQMFKPDHIDKDGNLFWAPPKKIPVPVPFNRNDQLHITYVLSCANLFATAFNIRKIELTEVCAYIENVLSLQEPDRISFGDTPVELKNLKPLTFDKDTWHVDFIYAAANLRARNYGIKERSKHFIRGVAGRIIPAIATTTAVVSGISTLEILRYATQFDPRNNDSSTAENNKLTCKNSYLDLAIPFLGSTELVKPKAHSFATKIKKMKFTVWSRLAVPNDTLANVVENIERTTGIEVSMLSLQSRVVYWNLSDKYDSNKNKTIAELCNKKKDQILLYLDVLPEEDVEMMDVVVMFEQ